MSMTDAIRAVADDLPRAAKGKPARRPASSLTQAMKTVASRKRNPPATRTGRKGIVIYVDQEVAVAIHRLASAFNNATVQALGEQAFKLLFAKYREPWPDRRLG
jgi:hypothetical protein